MPKPPKPPTTDPFRLVCFTEYDIERDMAELASHFQYLAYGEEVCPTTGRQHFQGFAYTAKAQRWSWYKKIFGKSHFEKCVGTLEDNEKYCSKEGTFIKYGTKPMGNGNKRSLAVFCEKLRDGADLEECICEDPVTACMYNNGLKAVALAFTNKRMKEARPDRVRPEVIYIYGPSGTGKSDYARIRYPGLYDVSDADHYKWKDGYNGEETVLYDNIDKTNFNRTALLREIDKYAIRCPIKGGFVNWRPRRIFITSVFSPEELAEQFNEPKEFLRRITTRLSYEDYFDPSLVDT